MARGKGYGAGFAFPHPRGGDDFSKPMAGRARGLYSGSNQSGGIRVPTLIESYEKESDYRRWQAGMQMFFGDGKGWLDQQLAFYARLKSGPGAGPIPLITQVFASLDSAESAWHVTQRPRGALILPQSIKPGSLTLDRDDPDPSKHRLIYDVRGVLDRDKLAVWRSFVGDQFEDSAAGSLYPEDLDPDPAQAVALTLIEVDVSKFQLIFDLSRAFIRQVSGPRSYWRRIGYSPQAPVFWRADATRHLCSSHRFECSCPDYQGRQIANLLGTGGSVRDRFPVASAGRGEQTSWEQQSIGYSKKWRDLERRVDRRRECKHIHAMRWQAGVPFYEPSDYPSMEGRQWVDERSLLDRDYVFKELGRALGQQMITFDRLLLAVAPSIGLELDPTGELRGGAPTFRPVNQPILWTDSAEPPYPWCRQNDWWSPRGTTEVWLFDPPSGGFVQQLDGADILQLVPVLGVGLDGPILPGRRVARLEIRLLGLGALGVARPKARRRSRGTLAGRGGLGGSRLVMTMNLQSALSGRGTLGSLVLYAAPVADLSGALGGRGGLGPALLGATATHVLETAQRGAGGLQATLKSGPPRDYFASWVVQRYGTEELGLIEWWGS